MYAAQGGTVGAAPFMSRAIATLPQFAQFSVTTTSLDLNVDRSDIYWTFRGVFKFSKQCLHILDKGDIFNLCRISMGR
jgi:hypothetical protein